MSDKKLVSRFCLYEGKYYCIHTRQVGVTTEELACCAERLADAISHEHPNMSDFTMHVLDENKKTLKIFNISVEYVQSFTAYSKD